VHIYTRDFLLEFTVITMTVAGLWLITSYFTLPIASAVN
jgi:hypothetical protein